ncbi:signal peptide-containing protein [Rutstroemia sp. NJR-2017a BVV2]|nr:signal peptide-containing protein [Rutstroemia sp. NJR-2017a BVV2]
MSIEVALQSVAFYVLSCSTCSKISHRRKAKAQAKKERAEKHELETEQPGLYRHPSPFSTNPFWTEEIMMGPGPPKKKGDKDKKNAHQRGLNTAGQGSSYASTGEVSTDTGSSPTAVEGSRISGEGWNLKRYQREDEDLWGRDTHWPGQRIMDAISRASESAGRMFGGDGRPGSRHGSDGNPESYYIARNPPVNDLHPPIVSTAPRSREETAWMLQPPPSAKVMEGKVRVNSRTRAGSNGSSRKGAPAPEGQPLSRIVTEKLMEQKVQRGETPSQLEIHSYSNRPAAQRRARDRSSSAGSSTASGASTPIRKPPPIAIPKASSGKQRGKAEHIPIRDTDTEMKETFTRPVLSTIISSSRLVHQVTKSQSNDLPLRELSRPTTGNSALNARAAASDPLPNTTPSTTDAESKFSNYKVPSVQPEENAVLA